MNRILLLAIAAWLFVGRSDVVAQEGALMPLDQAVIFWKQRTERDPGDFMSMTMLAHTYLRQARETGDFGGYERAEQVLKKALAIAPKYVSAQGYLAMVYCAQHRFRDGLNLAKKLLQENPGEPMLELVVGDAELELGHYTEAERAFENLWKRDTPRAPLLARRSRLSELRGKSDLALEQMRQAELAEKASGGIPLTLAWYRLRQGEIQLGMGKVDNAAELFSAILKDVPKYYLAMVGLAKAQAAQGKDADAIELLKQATVISQDPLVLVPLGDLYIKTGNKYLADVVYGRLEKSAEGQAAYARELSLLYSEQDRKPKEALELARKDLAARGDIYGHDALAWALYRNNQLDEAQAAMRDALKLGTRDPNLWYHAGMIELKRGDKEAARGYLKQALAVHPRFSILNASRAEESLRLLN